MTSPGRFLIVNADDLGRTDGVNRAIARCHEHGIVTSASLMVRQPFAAEAADYARAHPRLAVGLHVDLGEWELRNGEWKAVYELPLGTEEAVRGEVGRQLARFRELIGADPTHLDSHQHVHRDDPARSVLRELGRALRVPVRHQGGAVTYCGSFYGQEPDGSPNVHRVTVAALEALLARTSTGWTELCVHPDDGSGEHRRVEADTLCDPSIRAALARSGIELRSFRDLRQSGPFP